jgi:hypothetical protein
MEFISTFTDQRRFKISEIYIGQLVKKYILRNPIIISCYVIRYFS